MEASSIETVNAGLSSLVTLRVSDPSTKPVVVAVIVTVCVSSKMASSTMVIVNGTDS